MAASDKIYCNYAFKKWVEKYRLSLLEYFALYDTKQQ